MTKEEYRNLDDSELAVKYSEGDQYAFDCLFDRHQKPVRAFLMKYTKSTSKTDDILQETFIKASLKRDTYNASLPFAPWIITIAYRTFIDQQRTSKSDTQLEFKEEYMGQNYAPSPEDTIIQIQKVNKLSSIIDNLSDKYREPFKLRFLDDLSYEEISEKLKIPMGTVKTRINRARNQVIELYNIANNE